MKKLILILIGAALTTGLLIVSFKLLGDKPVDTPPASTAGQSSSASASSASSTSSSAASSQVSSAPSAASYADTSGENLQPLPTVATEGLANTATSWFHGTQVDANNVPLHPQNVQAAKGALGGVFIGPDSTKIYLTIDLGYEGGYTAQILDTLKEKNVKAVFFVTLSYAKNNKELINRMIDEGHVIGNHTNRHKSMPTLTEQEVADEIMVVDAYMFENYGYKMRLFRFPEGTYSDLTLAQANNLGYRSVFWSFAYADWDAKNQLDPAVALTRLQNSLHGGGIYLLHGQSSTNAAVLGNFIDYIYEKGFETATL